MRAFGIRISPPVARFLRFRAREFLAWPRESVFIAGGLYVRSWRMESLATLQERLGPQFDPEKIVDLRVWRPWWFLLPKNLRFDTVLTGEPYGRFGNRILQAAMGVAVAQNLRAGTLILRTDDFPRGVGRVELSDVEVLVDRNLGQVLGVSLPRGRPALILEANWLLSQAALPNRNLLAAGFASLRSSPFPLVPSKPLTRPDLVIHFRGTDQIGKDWRPPPLSYFTKAVNHSGARVVALITDDPQHVLVSELVARLDSRQVEVRTISGSLEDDAGAIAGASRFCLGIGTFSSSLAGLSRELTVAYSWQQADWASWTNFYGTFDLRPDVTNIEIFDARGEYVLPFESEYDFDEHAIVDHLASYPEAALEVRERLTL